jgi:hypothetical protein
LANPTRPRLLAHLPEWLKAWEDGRDDYNNLDDDVVITSWSRTIFFRRGYYYGIRGTRDTARRLAEEEEESHVVYFTRPAGEISPCVFKFSLLSTFFFVFRCSLYIVVYT